MVSGRGGKGKVERDGKGRGECKGGTKDENGSNGEGKDGIWDQDEGADEGRPCVSARESMRLGMGARYHSGVLVSRGMQPTCIFIYSPRKQLNHSPSPSIPPRTYSPITHSLAHSVADSLTHSPTHPPTHHSPTHSLTR